jgi:hypothetical protein
MASKKQVEAPINSAISVENAIRRALGIVSENFLFAESSIRQNSAWFLSNPKTYGYVPPAIIVFSGALEA